MLRVKEILAVVLFVRKFGDCQEWVPAFASPQLLQSNGNLIFSSHNQLSPHALAFSKEYLGRQIMEKLQVMRPPVLSPIWVRIPQHPAEVDFSKPKTQTLYKSSLTPAQPPVYQFRYKVHDPKEENYQEKSEMRVGDSVRGYYSVRDPDGYIRLVRYVSDENGFKTQVSHHHVDDNGGGYLFQLTRSVT